MKTVKNGFLEILGLELYYYVIGPRDVKTTATNIIFEGFSPWNSVKHSIGEYFLDHSFHWIQPTYGQEKLDSFTCISESLKLGISCLNKLKLKFWTQLEKKFSVQFFNMSQYYMTHTGDLLRHMPGGYSDATSWCWWNMLVKKVWWWRKFKCMLVEALLYVS